MSKKVRPIRIEGNIAFIPLTQGYEAIIDADDVHLVEGRNWSADTRVNNVYARAKVRQEDGSSKPVLLHKMLSGYAMTDHRDGNGLNNRRSNLRPATHAENMRNRSVYKNSSSGVRGVYPRGSGKWRAAITVDGHVRWLGTFYDIQDAAKAYAAASAELHGDFGRAG
jgi:hypothetical protein